MTPLIWPLPIGSVTGPSLLNGWPKPKTRSPITSVQVPTAVISASPVISGTASTEPGSSSRPALRPAGAEPPTPPACSGTSPAREQRRELVEHLRRDAAGHQRRRERLKVDGVGVD